MKSLTFKLAGPLQSWGNETAFDYRTSNLWPTKSAIVGLIGAAFGKDRSDDAWLKQANQLPIAVRIDQPGQIMRDFQTVDVTRIKKSAGAVITYRQYLQDAVFVIGIGETDSLSLEQIQAALKAPKYGLVLGRRSNPIGGVWWSEIIEAPNLIEALKAYPWQASEWYQNKHSHYASQIYTIPNLLPEKANMTGQYRDSICTSNRPDSRRFSTVSQASISVTLDKSPVK